MPIEKLPFRTKLAYGGLGGGIGLPSQIAFSAITYFYNFTLGLSEELAGLAWLIFSFWNAINDPLFGFIEDRTKSEKYGRRIPYIRFGAPIYGIVFILCWIPLVDLNDQFALFFNLTAVLFIFDTLFTILGLINFTLPAEMAITAKDRANLLIYGASISSVSYVIAYILPLLFLPGNKSPNAYLEFLIAMIVVGVICAITIFVSSFYLKENKYTQMEDNLPVIKGFIETFKNTPFLIYEVSNFAFTLAQTMLTTGILYYVSHVLMLTGFLTTLPLLLVFVMIFVFFLVFNKLVGIYGIKKTYVLALFWSGISFLLTFFIGWNFSFALIGFILIGIGFSGFMLTNQVVMADVVDYDETRTGKRRETTYSGINALITKPAISVANWLFLLIIARFGFVNEPITQTFSAQMGIMIGFSLIPAIFLVFCAFIMLFYPLDGPEWLAQKKELIKIHKEKEIEYLRYLEEKKKMEHSKI
jgi:GPH family glycoside/pentoside/hexuronide:cation symporter